MSKQTINLGTAPTGAGGDDSRGAMIKINSNFNEIYSAFGGDNIPAGSAAAYPLLGSTSAVFQRGSNANGYWVRFADGTQICWNHLLQTSSYAANSQSSYTQVTFPIAFVNAAYTLTASATPTQTWDFYGVTGIARQTAAYAYVFIRNGPVAQYFELAWQAVGQWK